MRIVLTETYEASDKMSGQAMFKLKKGSGYDAINPAYISGDAKILRLSGGDAIEKCNIDTDKYFFFYLFYTFFAVHKDNCFVPKVHNGKVNV